ncbi:MAG TPA: hypothetical protein VE863_00015 [Pyrinomonadaceae bacterium]|jgi:hypothetical protein|nr:hypothetical protein [Pyrinomonadaceae bacterium]
MLVTKKMLLALTLVGAIVGAGIGSLATRSSQTTAAASTNYDTTKTGTAYDNRTPEQIAANNSAQFATTEEQNAYRQGYDAGFSACQGSAASTSRSVGYESTGRTSRVARHYSNSRRVYYDYNSSSRGRTFWQKHRDKLTLAIGSGVGAAIGGLAGGGKGAGIGALAGLGGSALYTYKLRHRTPRY